MSAFSTLEEKTKAAKSAFFDIKTVIYKHQNQGVLKKMLAVGKQSKAHYII